MRDIKQHYELGKSKKIILPDRKMFESSNFLDLDDKALKSKIYVHPTICERIKEELNNNWDKDLKIKYDQMNGFLLNFLPGENSLLKRLIKRNREIKNLDGGKLNPDSYSFLMAGAAIAINRGGSIMLSDDEDLGEAYSKLIYKNSYLKSGDFSLYKSHSFGFEEVGN